MPGLTVVADGAVRAVSRAMDVDRLAAACHFPDYETRIVFAAPSLWVAATCYPEYPIAVWEASDVVAVLEGRIYDREPARVGAELLELARGLFRAAPGVAIAARRFTFGDGDFVAVLIDRATESAVVLNDRYGRLPLYRSARGGATIVSRELGFVAGASGTPRLRREGIAQFLLFGYPLGDETLFADVRRVPGATMVRLPAGSSTTFHEHDFERKDPARAADPGLAGQLADRLQAAAATRAAGGGRTLVSLSGGLDSRMVAGALRRAGVAARAVSHRDAFGVAARAVSHRDAFGVAARDAEVAARVAERLGMPWELYPVAAHTGADVQRLLALKAGANYVGMSRVLPYLTAVRQRYGAGIVFATGDQGDRILGDVTPAVAFRRERDLAEYVLRKESILGPDRVAAMTGVPRARLLDAVRARLADYPERSLVQKYVHFLFYERARNWLFEGEDRNRCHFWHVTPFYAPDVFEGAMRLPDGRKARHRLRAEVLAILAPETADLPNAGTGGVVGRPAFMARRRLEEIGRAMLARVVSAESERRLKRWLRPAHGHDAQSSVVDCVRAQLRGPGPMGEYLNPDAVERVLDDAGAYKREQFSVVFTVTSLIDGLAGGTPVLERFRDTAMT